MPQLHEWVHTGFIQREAAQIDHTGTTGQRFGYSADNLGRGAAEQKETRRLAGAIQQHPQGFKQGGLALDLVNDHEPGQRSQGLLRLSEFFPVDGVLQIEEGDHRTAGGKFARQRGFAALARTRKRHRRMNTKILFDSGQNSGASKHEV